MGRRTRAPPPEPPTGAGGGRGVEYENKGGTRIGVEGGGRRQRGGRPLAGGVHLFLRGGGGEFPRACPSSAPSGLAGPPVRLPWSVRRLQRQQWRRQWASPPRALPQPRPLASAAGTQLPPKAPRRGSASTSGSSATAPAHCGVGCLLWPFFSLCRGTYQLRPGRFVRPVCALQREFPGPRH